MPASTDLLQRPWRNDFVERLPHLAEGAPHLPRDTPGVCSSAASPEPVPEPRILSWSADCAAQLGLQRPQAENESELAALRTSQTKTEGHSALQTSGQCNNPEHENLRNELAELKREEDRQRELQENYDWDVWSAPGTKGDSSSNRT